MTARKSNHIHKLRRKTYSTGNSIFFCIGEECTFKIAAELTLGKLTLCNNCNQPFKMNEYSIRVVKPKCNNCIKRKFVPVLESTSVINPIESAESTSASTINNLQERMGNLIIKEFTPDDDSDVL